MFLILVILSIIFLNSFIQKRTDRIAARSLEDGIEKRFKSPGASNDVTEYEALLSTEKEILEYNGSNFGDENYQLYIDGLKKQKDSLEFYDTDSQKFGKMWYEVEELRYNSIMELYKTDKIELSDETLAKVGAGVLEHAINNAIAKRATYFWDVNKRQYYLDITAKNVTNLDYKNIVVNIEIGSETKTYRIDEWK